MITRITQLTVAPIGAPIFDERATKIEIADEAGGEFIELVQDDRRIRLDSDEWPVVRSAVDRMAKEIRKHDEKNRTRDAARANPPAPM